LPLTRRDPCNNFGTFAHGKCKCIEGVTGEHCNMFLSTMCDKEGRCPQPDTYCYFKNADCWLNPQLCHDKRGWCLPFD
ncbi:hypothetical protein PFISCL1PPCAC_29016, partial [Pristionchus fissidentatus]